jgi:hypothetical protein
MRTAEAVAAFVDDPHRFRNAKAVGRYFGLVPDSVLVACLRLEKA